MRSRFADRRITPGSRRAWGKRGFLSFVQKILERVEQLFPEFDINIEITPKKQAAKPAA